MKAQRQNKRRREATVKKKKSNSDTLGRPTVTNLRRKGETGRGAIIKLTLSPDQSTIFSAEFDGNEGTNTAKSSLPTWIGV